LLLYVAWVSGTAVGVVAGDALGDPKDIGLDGAFPALFLALLVPLLPSRRAVVAALVVTQTVGGDNELVLDARLAGVGAGAAAIAVRAPLPVVVIVAAAVTALARVLL